MMILFKSTKESEISFSVVSFTPRRRTDTGMEANSESSSLVKNHFLKTLRKEHHPVFLQVR